MTNEWEVEHTETYLRESRARSMATESVTDMYMMRNTRDVTIASTGLPLLLASYCSVFRDALQT